MKIVFKDGFNVYIAIDSSSGGYPGYVTSLLRAYIFDDETKAMAYMDAVSSYSTDSWIPYKFEEFSDKIVLTECKLVEIPLTKWVIQE